MYLSTNSFQDKVCTDQHFVDDERQNRDGHVDVDDEDLLYCQQGQHQGVRRHSCQKQKSGRSSLPRSLPSPRCPDSEASKKFFFKLIGSPE